MHTAFWVLSTHYQLDLATVTPEGPFEEYTEEDLKEVREEVRPFAEGLGCEV